MYTLAIRFPAIGVATIGAMVHFGFLNGLCVGAALVALAPIGN